MAALFHWSEVDASLLENTMKDWTLLISGDLTLNFSSFSGSNSSGDQRSQLLPLLLQLPDQVLVCCFALILVLLHRFSLSFGINESMLSSILLLPHLIKLFNVKPLWDPSSSDNDRNKWTLALLRFNHFHLLLALLHWDLSGTYVNS